MSKFTEGEWIMATSCSYRRIMSEWGDPVCVPVKQRDGHPDLHFPNGGWDGPDANLMLAAKDGYYLAINLESMIMNSELNHNPHWKEILDQCCEFINKAEGKNKS